MPIKQSARNGNANMHRVTLTLRTVSCFYSWTETQVKNAIKAVAPDCLEMQSVI